MHNASALTWSFNVSLTLRQVIDRICLYENGFGVMSALTDSLTFGSAPRFKSCSASVAFPCIAGQRLPYKTLLIAKQEQAVVS